MRPPGEVVIRRRAQLRYLPDEFQPEAVVVADSGDIEDMFRVC
jgi:hypothetical protein